MRIWNLLLVFVLSVALFWLCAGSLTAPAAALSGIHYVAPGGNCGAGVTPCYATLQAAIDAAASGDEVRVAQGVYVDVTTLPHNLGGSLQTITQTMFIDKNLTLRGGYTLTNWTTAEPPNHPTVINPQGQGRGGVIVSPNPDARARVTLEGLSIVNGYDEGNGGGLYVESSDVVIHDCYVMSNTGGLILWNAHSTLTNTVIAANAITSSIPISKTGLTVIGGKLQAWHTTLADNGSIGLRAQNLGQSPAHAAMTNTILSGHELGVHATGNPQNPTIVELVGQLWGNLQQKEFDEGGRITNTRDKIDFPEFMGAGDYRLTAASPARNCGVASFVKYDIIGVQRDLLPDLGAYEYDDPESIRQVFLPLVMRNATGMRTN